MNLPALVARNLRLKALALALSCVAWVGVVYAANPPESRSITVAVPQDTASIPPQFVLVRSIAPITVEVTGTRDHIISFDSQSLHVTVDYGVVRHAGVQDVPIMVADGDRNVSIAAAPAEVEADFDSIGSRVTPLRVDISKPPPQGYIVVGAPAVSPASVTLTGPVHQLAGVVSRVQLDLSNQKTNLAQDAQVLLVDSSGRPASGLSVLPPTVQVTVTIATTETSRSSAALPQTTGSVPAGYALVGISVQPSTVTLFGPRDVLNSLDAVSTSPIDLSRLTSDVVIAVAVTPPPGVSADVVTVTVALHIKALPSPTASPAPTPTPTALPTPTAH